MIIKVELKHSSLEEALSDIFANETKEGYQLRRRITW
jgi:hypothetical protein